MVRSVTYRHEVCMAHRLVDYKGGCKRIHGHNYIIDIEVVTYAGVPLNGMGMIIDFRNIKRCCGQWLDANWDHRLIKRAVKPLPLGGGYKAHPNWNFCL